MDWLEWVWLGIFLGALAFEFVTADLVSIWFSLGAIPSYILSLFNVNPVLQIVLFFIITAVLLFVTRPVVMKYFKTNEIKTNVDSVIGQHAICVEDILIDTIGAVKLKTQVWSAISSEPILVNERVRILDVEGVKLIVEKIDK